MRALAPEVRFESFNLYAIALEDEGQLCLAFSQLSTHQSTEPSMPENNVDDLITDQEIAFARLVFSGTTTDRQAADAVGLNPDTASYTKSKPCVRAWMLEHRAAVQQQIVQQDTEELRRFNVGRDRVLARLWDIANLNPEMTRNSMSAQVKALSLIVAIEGLIPDRHSARRAVSAENKPAPPLVHPPFYVSEWMRTQQQGKNVDPQPPRPLTCQKASKKPLPAGPMTRRVLGPTQLQ
jgi:hypothetical protein